MNNREHYNQIIDQMEKLFCKLHELYIDRSDIKIQMSRKTICLKTYLSNTLTSLSLQESLLNSIMGLEIEVDDNLKEWEVNIKFQDTLMDNPNGTTTRVTTYINLNDIDKLRHIYGDRVIHLRRIT
ncbi:MAG: hypothetical protein ACRC1T_05380 [Clostridium chrysemydis]|uniref:hypothetical protein n=1 Tax=Clostridium chrysemydis TaxID=2665504 RepID=UPI003F3DC100